MQYMIEYLGLQVDKISSQSFEGFKNQEEEIYI